jgi:hypothetical protein
MIIDGLLALPIAVLETLIGLLPDYSGLPNGMETSLDWLATQSMAIGDIFPTDTMWDVVVLVVAIEIAIMAFNTLAWLLHWKQPK